MSPTRPPSPCSVPQCGGFSEVRGRCRAHATERERDRGFANERGYDARWRALRIDYLLAHPICIDCGAQATVPDHFPRSRKELLADPTVVDPDAWEHLVPRCKPCHDSSTGRRRK